MVLKLTDANFDTHLHSSGKLIIVDFWTEWCGPCAEMSPIIEKLAHDYEGKAIVGKINVDENPWIAIQKAVTTVPVIMFFRNSQIVYKHFGKIPKEELDKEIQEYLQSPDKIQEGLKSQHEPGRERPDIPDSKIMHPGSDGSFKGQVGSF